MNSDTPQDKEYETPEGWKLMLSEVPEEPGEGERRANRKERRDYIRSLPRMVRLGYGFGQWRKFPGRFISPAKPR